jgi:hypothetical protein
MNDLLYKTNSSDTHTLLYKPVHHIKKYSIVIDQLLQVSI